MLETRFKWAYRYLLHSLIRLCKVMHKNDDNISKSTKIMLYLHTKRLFLVIIQLKTMNNIHYNRIKAVLAEKDKTGTWLSEKMDRNIGTVSRWMTNKVQPSVEQLFEIAHHLDVDVKELLVSSK